MVYFFWPIGYNKYMSFETPPVGIDSTEREIHKETPARFRVAVETYLRAHFSDIEIVGEENLDDLPPDAKVILTTTHISDLDVLIPIAKLGQRFCIKAVNASVQHQFGGDTIANIGLRIVGKENTIPVDYKMGEHPQAGKSYYTQAFNPNNFVPMKESLDKGETIVMAAYGPQQVKDGKLPKKGASGPVYLAEISGATIVPIAINIESDDPEMGTSKSPFKSLKQRPKAQMIIGKPFIPDKIEGIEKMPELLKTRGNEAGGAESLDKLREIQHALREQSDKIMSSLASALPENKRGDWGKEIEDPGEE